jgi:(2Fe-2S) ferredoxin
MTLADGTSADRFCSIGRFLRFLPGEKSPYQKLLWEMLDAEGNSSAKSAPQQLWLGSNLRKMMYRYLEPHDWIRIVGKQVIDKRSAQLMWKATEISKLSSAQVNQLKNSQLKNSQPRNTQFRDDAILNSRDDSFVSGPLKTAENTDKPVRVLICQKSGCRQRGSVAIAEAMEGAIAQSTCPQKVTVQATGCMKRCKAGPNVVMLPGGSYSQVTPAEGLKLIHNRLNAGLRQP